MFQVEVRWAYPVENRNHMRGFRTLRGWTWLHWATFKNFPAYLTRSVTVTHNQQRHYLPICISIPIGILPRAGFGGNAPWFICWFWRYLKWFVCLLNFLPYFLHSILSSLLIYFLTRLLPDLSTHFRIDRFRFKAGGRRRRPNLALVYCVNSMLQYILLRMHVCFCCV